MIMSLYTPIGGNVTQECHSVQVDLPNDQGWRRATRSVGNSPASEELLLADGEGKIIPAFHAGEGLVCKYGDDLDGILLWLG